MATLVVVIGLVTKVKVADLLPAFTVTDVGAVAKDCATERATLNPPLGAALDRFTVPVAGLAAVTVVVANLMLATRTGGSSTVSLLDAVYPFSSVASIVAEVVDVTGLASTENVAVFAPALTTTVLGKLTAAEVLERERGKPPAGASAERVTVAVADLETSRDVGERDSSASLTAGGAMVNVASEDFPAGSTPFIVALAVVSILEVVMVKFALSAPAAISTVAGIWASLDEEESVILRPLAVAALLRLTVPVTLWPAITEPWDSAIPWIFCPGAIARRSPKAMITWIRRRCEIAQVMVNRQITSR